MNHIPTEMRGEKATEVADFKDRVRTGLFVLGGETVMKERLRKKKEIGSGARRCKIRPRAGRGKDHGSGRRC